VGTSIVAPENVEKPIASVRIPLNTSTHFGALNIGSSTMDAGKRNENTWQKAKLKPFDKEFEGPNKKTDNDGNR